MFKFFHISGLSHSLYKWTATRIFLVRLTTCLSFLILTLGFTPTQPSSTPLMEALEGSTLISQRSPHAEAGAELTIGMKSTPIRSAMSFIQLFMLQIIGLMTLEIMIIFKLTPLDKT